VYIDFSRDFAPDPNGGAYIVPQTSSWWEGGSPLPPQEPHPTLTSQATGLVVSLPNTSSLKINTSYGLGIARKLKSLYLSSVKMLRK